MTFSLTTRKEEIDRLKNEQLDLLVIGGGITGAGVALQAAAANMKTGLIDMQDFGGGTSSRSTRLVHGGIRYLKTFDVQVVSDTVKERAVIQHIAPHMTQPDPMILPIYDEPGTTFTMFSVKVAMDLYDHLAGIEGDSPLMKYANYTIDKEETLKREPQLNPVNLQGAGVYLDYQNNDSRLVVENVKKAHTLGCLAVSRLKCIEILHDDQGHVNGVKVKDQLTDEEFTIHANVVINTSGPWSDTVRQEDKQVYKKPRLRPTKGVHLVVDQSRLKVPQPTYFGSGTADGRMIFTIPREGKTYFGTTDTDFTGDYAHPTVEQSDVDYLLDIINRKYPSAHLTVDDIEASWAGVRPLIEAEVSPTEAADAVSGASVSDSTSAPSAVSRGSSLTEAEDGLITLAGGKLTDYRIMANGALAKIKQKQHDEFGKDFVLQDSAEIKVAGGDFDSDNAEAELAAIAQRGTQSGISQEDATEIANLFGSEADQIFEHAQEIEPAEGLTLGQTAALDYSLNEEMALTPVDYLLRRTYHVLFKNDTIDEVKVGVIKHMAAYYDWDQDQISCYEQELNTEIAESRLEKFKK
ncbi:FAD-dependent oxidoreductase [Lactobacillus sp. ESL0731]|uniref:FAD-dependent oxidoreductase n=1 Tax=unclassified Lactobacillus TaxID=2620435 RepID=UPI0023F68C94|nr:MULTISPECIES: FAD-dependent oxidoreductase [unclassified Lactobacillus]WEV51790.1 FAD-dependent oxidoreductase [Lactobacillus sp. ESL0700]WEV62919.1 FAD-dependent oxidoreductase [Lactobacillus sp. ESL0731]